jgi:hypothetical protein
MKEHAPEEVLMSTTINPVVHYRDLEAVWCFGTYRPGG